MLEFPLITVPAGYDVERRALDDLTRWAMEVNVDITAAVDLRDFDVVANACLVAFQRHAERLTAIVDELSASVVALRAAVPGPVDPDVAGSQPDRQGSRPEPPRPDTSPEGT